MHNKTDVLLVPCPAVVWTSRLQNSKWNPEHEGRKGVKPDTFTLNKCLITYGYESRSLAGQGWHLCLLRNLHFRIPPITLSPLSPPIKQNWEGPCPHNVVSILFKSLCILAYFIISKNKGLSESTLYNISKVWFWVMSNTVLVSLTQGWRRSHIFQPPGLLWLCFELSQAAGQVQILPQGSTTL